MIQKLNMLMNMAKQNTCDLIIKDNILPTSQQGSREEL